VDKRVLLAPSCPGFVGDQGLIQLNAPIKPPNPVVFVGKIPCFPAWEFFAVLG
jgi:hypothetical protein